MKFSSFAPLLFLALCAGARGQSTYSDLHDFGGIITNSLGQTVADGSGPMTGVTFDSSGNMYGSTTGGGAHNLGIIWEITAAGKYLDLHDFGGTITNAKGISTTDGSSPNGITLDTSGNLYGTTPTGGVNKAGIIWELTSAGVYKDLHDFGGSGLKPSGAYTLDGTVPSSPVSFDSHGNLYGTTAEGAASGDGIVWEYNTSGVYEIIHIFGGPMTNSSGQTDTDGAHPYAGVVFDSAGNLYGAASADGGLGAGNIWKISTTGTYTILYDFDNNFSSYFGPNNITIDPSGNLYGSHTYFTKGIPYGTFDGDPGDYIWKFSTANGFQILYEFGQTIDTDSGTPYYNGFDLNPVTLDSSGNLWGTTVYGGPDTNVETLPSGSGIMWGLTPSGSLTDLHDFGASITSGGKTFTDGMNSGGAVTFDKSGNLYGSSSAGGANGKGIVWELKSPSVSNSALTSFTVPKSTLIGGDSMTGTIQLSGPAPTGGLTVNLSTDSFFTIGIPATVTVPAGATKATFTITSSQVSGSALVFITAKAGTVTQTVEFNVVPLFSGLDASAGYGGLPVSVGVTLAEAAPAGGVLVQVQSSNPSAVPSTTFTVPAGQTNYYANVPSLPVASSTQVTLDVTCASRTLETSVDLLPLPLSSVSVSPSSLIGGASATGTVTVKISAPSGGFVVSLSSSSSSVKVPSSVTIPANATTATFNVTSSAVSSKQTATITATLGDTVVTTQVTVNPAVASSVTLNPTSVVGGSSSTGTVTLTGPAPSGGTVVTLSSSDSSAKTPASVTVAAGKTSATFTVTTTAVTSTHSATITAKAGGVSATATLTVTS